MTRQVKKTRILKSRPQIKISICLPDELKSELTDVAIKRGLTISEIVRGSIVKELKVEEI